MPVITGEVMETLYHLTLSIDKLNLDLTWAVVLLLYCKYCSIILIC